MVLPAAPANLSPSLQVIIRPLASRERFETVPYKEFRGPPQAGFYTLDLH
jgi:hypothetical protein